MAKQTRDVEFTEYVASRGAWLRQVAYLLCSDWHRADDLVQESITKLYVQWPRAGRVENVDGYARRVLVNTFLSEQRTGWWRRRGTVEVPVEQVAPAADLDVALDLREALAAIPPRQRAAVVLRYYCDLSVDQAAEALGCSSGTVKSQSARGVGALRRLLGVRPVASMGRSV
ncbi:SigE family RNA polymerase sigma factor [Kitasatospora camelliae]|uniref:SigE family RNA polymerase sigma factor n=1 Tax=Kitasatospora camelliae TaxID=3156397 RepID=A0AAU8JU43_9ACTN